MTRETTLEVAGRPLRMMEGGDGPPLLFLHGAGGAAWTPLLERLSRHRRVLLPEHPGFGRGDLPDWMMSTGDVAFFYLDLLDALRLEAVDLAGHSLGGWIAAEIAIRDAARLRSLALLSPAGVKGPVPFGDIFLWSPEEAARRGCHDPDIAEARVKALATVGMDVLLQNRAAAARLAWNPRLHNPQLPFWLHRIRIPTLLMWGAEDQVIPAACLAEWQRGIPHATSAVLAATGHALGHERVEDVAARIEDFLKEAGR